MVGVPKYSGHPTRLPLNGRSGIDAGPVRVRLRSPSARPRTTFAAMIESRIEVPVTINRPVRSYAPGSAERHQPPRDRPQPPMG